MAKSDVSLRRGSLADADWDLDVSIEFESEVAIVGAVSDVAKATVEAMEEA